MVPRSGRTRRRRLTGPWRGCGSCRARCWTGPPRRTATVTARAMVTARPPAVRAGAVPAVMGGCCRGWGGASREERIAAALSDLEAVREAEEAARREEGAAYLAKVKSGEVPPGPVPAGVAGPVAEIALERAVAAQVAKCDAYDRRVTASGGPGVRGPRPAPPDQAASVQRCRERLAAARKARAAQASEAGQGP